MKKISLIATLLFAILLLENCKKDTVNAVATSTYFLAATINDSTFVTDTTTASVNYNSATNSKTFTCFGTANGKKIAISITKNTGVGNTSGFPLGNFNVDATSNVLLTYYTLQKGANGTLGYVSSGTVAPGSGRVNIAAIDSVNKVITGTFSFTIINSPLTIINVLDGGLNSMPYTFTSN